MTVLSERLDSVEDFTLSPVRSSSSDSLPVEGVQTAVGVMARVRTLRRILERRQEEEKQLGEMPVAYTHAVRWPQA